MWGSTSIIHHNSSVFPLKTYKIHIKPYIFHHFWGLNPTFFTISWCLKKRPWTSNVSGGQSLVAAGYVLYSASTELVLTFGQGVVGFTLDTSTWDLADLAWRGTPQGPWVFGR